MTNSRRTNFQDMANAKGLTDSSGRITGTLNHQQLQELLDIADGAGVRLSIPANSAKTPFDYFVLAPNAAAVDTNSIVVMNATQGPQNVGFATYPLKSITVTQGTDTMAASSSAGAITITMANSTGSKNTLTLVAVALSALSLAAQLAISVTIKGTASTQFATSGENVTVTVPGGTPGGCILSTGAGTGPVAVTPA